jgi:hypothetical protein
VHRPPGGLADDVVTGDIKSGKDLDGGPAAAIIDGTAINLVPQALDIERTSPTTSERNPSKTPLPLSGALTTAAPTWGAVSTSDQPVIPSSMRTRISRQCRTPRASSLLSGSL